MSFFDNCPDSVLLTIFDHLPLGRLLAFQIVCRRWARLINVRAFQRRQSLVIGGENGPPFHFVEYNLERKEGQDNFTTSFPNALFTNEIDHLRLTRRGRPNINQLGDKFANLTSLLVMFDHLSTGFQFDTVLSLLQTNPLRTTLTRFHLSLINTMMNYIRVVAFFKAISELTSLRRLALDVDFSHDFTDFLELTFLKTLKLDYYYFGPKHGFESFYDAQLKVICTAALDSSIPPPTSLSLGKGFSLPVLMNRKKISSSVALAFTTMILWPLPDEDLPLFRPFCNSFSRLITLQLNRTFTVRQFKELLLPSLAELSYLTKLVIQFCEPNTKEDSDNSKTIEKSLQKMSISKKSNPLLPTLPSVTILFAKVDLPSHNLSYDLELPQVFPNLTKLHYYNDATSCTVCGNFNKRTAEECFHNIFKPFSKMFYHGSKMQQIIYLSEHLNCSRTKK